jgi:hypothetical protein
VIIVVSSIGMEIAHFRHLGQKHKLPPLIVYGETQITAIPRMQGNLSKDPSFWENLNYNCQDIGNAQPIATVSG